MQSSIAVGISLPREIISKIDNERGDVSRSRYLLRIVQRVYESVSKVDAVKKNSLDSFDNRLTLQKSSESKNA